MSLSLGGSLWRERTKRECSDAANPMDRLNEHQRTRTASGNTPIERGSTSFISECSGLSCIGAWAVHRLAEQQISGMEQRRFFEARGEESGEWLVLDAKRHPPRVISRCHGWNAPKNAVLIAAALEAFNSELY